MQKPAISEHAVVIKLLQNGWIVDEKTGLFTCEDESNCTLQEAILHDIEAARKWRKP